MLDSEIVAFMEAYEIAKSNGLEYEFLLTFFQLNDSEPFEQRVLEALYEWDMA